MSTIPIPEFRPRPEPLRCLSPRQSQIRLADILQYISAGWDTLTRSMNRCESLEDTKTGGEAGFVSSRRDGDSTRNRGTAKTLPRSSGAPSNENYEARRN